MRCGYGSVANSLLRACWANTNFKPISSQPAPAYPNGPAQIAEFRAPPRIRGKRLERSQGILVKGRALPGDNIDMYCKNLERGRQPPILVVQFLRIDKFTVVVIHVAKDGIDPVALMKFTQIPYVRLYREERPVLAQNIFLA